MATDNIPIPIDSGKKKVPRYQTLIAADDILTALKWNLATDYLCYGYLCSALNKAIRKNRTPNTFRFFDRASGLAKVHLAMAFRWIGTLNKWIGSRRTEWNTRAKKCAVVTLVGFFAPVDGGKLDGSWSNRRRYVSTFKITCGEKSTF